MEFNIGKCKSLHNGYRNAMREYTIDEEVLQTTYEEKDPGVLIVIPSLYCRSEGGF